jgi:hypothetical protein
LPSEAGRRRQSSQADAATMNVHTFRAGDTLHASTT